MPVGNIGIFDTKRVFCANKSFKNTIYSRFLEFKSRLAHQKKTDIRKDIRFLLLMQMVDFPIVLQYNFYIKPRKGRFSYMDNRFSLAGKVAVVTGANGTFGSEFCRTFAEAGAAAPKGGFGAVHHR